MYALRNDENLRRIKISDIENKEKDGYEVVIQYGNFRSIKFSYPPDYPFKPFSFTSNPDILKMFRKCECCLFGGEFEASNWSPALSSSRFVFNLLSSLEGNTAVTLPTLFWMQVIALQRRIKNLNIRREIKQEIIFDFLMKNVEAFIREFLRLRNLSCRSQIQIYLAALLRPDFKRCLEYF